MRYFSPIVRSDHQTNENVQIRILIDCLMSNSKWLRGEQISIHLIQRFSREINQKSRILCKLRLSAVILLTIGGNQCNFRNEFSSRMVFVG